MSKQNPAKAMAALLPPTIEIDGYAVRPMTLGMYAALERIGSPLVTGEAAKDLLSLIPSLYLITHDPRVIFQGNLLDLAMQWADTLPISAVERIKAAAEKQMGIALDVVPEEEESGKPKKKRTAGSHSSSTGARQPTTGRSPTSSGKCHSPRSASYADKTA